MTVSRGYVDFTVAGQTTRLTSGMAEFHIPAGQRHGIHKPKGIVATFHERCIPDPQARIEFFKDLLSEGRMVSCAHLHSIPVGPLFLIESLVPVAMPSSRDVRIL